MPAGAGGSPASQAEYPAVRADVWLGPRFRRGAGTFYVLKESRSGRCFEVGRKEQFIISRMDGMTSTDEIGAQYAREFGRRLDHSSWTRIIRLLWMRGVLAGSPPPRPDSGGPAAGGMVAGDIAAAGPDTAGEGGGSGPAAARAAAAFRRRLQRAWSGQLVFGDPAVLVRRLDRCLRPVFSRAGGVLVVLIGSTTLVASLIGAHQLVTQAAALRFDPDLILAALLPIWLVLAVHELSHAVAARWAGADASEIGMRWRFPVAYLYCATRDLHLVHGAGRRAVVTAAGIAGGLCVAAPFGLVWLISRPDSPTQRFAALVLVFAVSQALLNLLPFPDLDGYRLVCHSLGVANLATESFVFVRSRLRRGSQPGPADAYSRTDQVIYLSYAAGASLLVAGGCAILDIVILHFVPDIYGRIAVGVLTGATCVQLVILLSAGSWADRLRRLDPTGSGS